MLDFESLLEQQLEEGKEKIEERVTWFYAYFLSSPEPETWPPGRPSSPAEEAFQRTLIARAGTILSLREQRVLPAPKGELEAKARKNPGLLKKDFLRMQLCDIVEAYGHSLRMQGPENPNSVRAKLDNRLDRFVEETSAALAEEVQRSLLRGNPVDKTTKNLTRIFEREARRVNVYAEQCYRQKGWYRALGCLEQAQPRLYTFIAEAGETLAAVVRSCI